MTEIALEVDGIPITGTVEHNGSMARSLRYVRGHPRLRQEPWLRIAALTLHDPEIEWWAEIIARNPSSSKRKPQITRFRLSGESPAERVNRAHTVLAFAVDLARRAHRAPVPILERSTWRKADKGSAGEVERDMNRDLARPWPRRLFGSSPALVLARQVVPTFDHGVSGEVDRFSGYAAAIRGVWEQTTFDPGAKGS